MLGYDIICLSETKTDDPCLCETSLSSYQKHVMYKKNTRHKLGGIHGLCILMKNKLFEKSQKIENTCSECILWIKLDKDVTGFELILGAVYLPCEGSIYHHHDIFSDIAQDLITLKSDFNIPVCLIGDFNARTGLLDDFLHIENEISNLTGLDRINHNLDMRGTLSELGFITDRFNNDLMTNSNGLHLTDMCKSFDLNIVNGRFGDDKEIGDYTCYNKNGGRSTVDYAIVSNNIFENILNFNVDTFDNCLSDVHCPITLSLHAVNTNHIPNIVQPHDDEVTDSEGAPAINMSFKWSLDKATEFKNNISVCDLDILSCELEGVKLDPSQENIDTFCNKLCGVFIETAKKNRCM